MGKYIPVIVKKYNYSIEGMEFGRLKVLNRVKNLKGRQSRWLCQCECGSQKIIDRQNLVGGITESCGCKHKDIIWKGYKTLSGTYWNCIIKKAKRYNQEFDISIQYGYNLYLEQKGKCALSGIDISLEKSYYTKSAKKQTASLDRINSSIGYIDGNVQWVHKDLNKMKMDLDQDKFIRLCEKVYKYNLTHKEDENGKDGNLHNLQISIS